ncbi:unnamed protein product [Ilex paraguariensis]|uniref:Tryptophanyl-tRNA synthetase n=1 Tax=Ilex paraguariensis TaxID=185542 RepID=A0ABC8RCJ2_9AQUA
MVGCYICVLMINKYAFSGGQDSVENHRKYGANLEVDIPIKYLGFFLDDDAELDHIRREYGAGRMLTGEVKKRLIEVLTEVVERHRRARAAVTDEAPITKKEGNFSDGPKLQYYHRLNGPWEDLLLAILI